MSNIWPVIQPMSSVADFACCAILDFRSPCGNDFDNQGKPLGLSTVANIATSDLSAKAGLALQDGKQNPLQASADNRDNYYLGYLGQTGKPTSACMGRGMATGTGHEIGLLLLGKGRHQTTSRTNSNR